jgi:hypothetical protein
MDKTFFLYFRYFIGKTDFWTEAVYLAPGQHKDGIGFEKQNGKQQKY